MPGKKANPVVAIDTMALIWGIKKTGPEEERKRAKLLFDYLDTENAYIIVPSIVVAEYLTAFPEQSRTSVLGALSGRFFLAPFDAKCAPLAAKLWEMGRKGRRKGKSDSRKCIRADTLIIATARVHGAQRFFSHDEDCRKLASTLMVAEDLPDQPDKLWDYD